MVRDILVWPHPVLKQVASCVGEVSEPTRALVRDMFDTMYAAGGVGLAAPQVGVLERVVVLDTTCRQPESRALVLINPVIVAAEGEVTSTEACLSIPDEAEDVRRAARVTVRFLDVDGLVQVLVCDGLLAIAVQHELDHLDGVVYVDHVSMLKRGLIRRRMKRRNRGAPEQRISA